MAARKDGDAVALERRVLDRLMPMNLLVRPSGHITHAGPTLSRLFPEEELVGRRFLEVFEMGRQHHGICTFSDLRALREARLQLRLRAFPDLRLKGVMVALDGAECTLINLSFGLSIIKAVRRFGLSNDDFAPTDLVIEMLYLVEANTAVMEEFRGLSARLQQARSRAEEQALRDPLTGLHNRRAMDAVLADLVARGKRFGLMHLDLDHFKAVNDTLGHAAGDHVLQVTAGILRSETRKGDTVARVGGDEFVLIFEDLVDPEKLSAIAERIVARLGEPIDYAGQLCRISGSIGFTTSCFYDRPDLDRMLSDVDLALYESKGRGRARATMVTRELLETAAPPGRMRPPRQGRSGAPGPEA